jgi:hypothetical protein
MNRMMGEHAADFLEEACKVLIVEGASTQDLFSALRMAKKNSVHPSLLRACVTLQPKLLFSEWIASRLDPESSFELLLLIALVMIRSERWNSFLFSEYFNNRIKKSPHFPIAVTNFLKYSENECHNRLNRFRGNFGDLDSHKRSVRGNSSLMLAYNALVQKLNKLKHLDVTRCVLMKSIHDSIHGMEGILNKKNVIAALWNCSRLQQPETSSRDDIIHMFHREVEAMKISEIEIGKGRAFEAKFYRWIASGIHASTVGAGEHEFNNLSDIDSSRGPNSKEISDSQLPAHEKMMQRLYTNVTEAVPCMGELEEHAGRLLAACGRGALRDVDVVAIAQAEDAWLEAEGLTLSNLHCFLRSYHGGSISSTACKNSRGEAAAAAAGDPRRVGLSQRMNEIDSFVNRDLNCVHSPRIMTGAISTHAGVGEDTAFSSDGHMMHVSAWRAILDGGGCFSLQQEALIERAAREAEALLQALREKHATVLRRAVAVAQPFCPYDVKVD